MYDKETEEYAQGQEELINPLEYRIHSYNDNRTDNRQSLMRDYARVFW